MFQCQWKRLSSGVNLLPGEEEESKQIVTFLKHHYKDRPNERLAPRVALRGGKVECFGVKFDASEEPGFSIIHLDYNSL